MNRKWYRKPEIIVPATVALVAAFISGPHWWPWSKKESINSIKPAGNNSQNVMHTQIDRGGYIIQARDNSMVQINYYSSEDVEKLKDENKELREKLQELKTPKTPFANRSKLIVVSPSVTITNWLDGSVVYGETVTGCVTASFDIKFLNIGGVNAKDITTKWTILDNGNNITGLNEWLEFLKQPPLVIKDLATGNIISIKYGPHIGASGLGTLKLVLDYQYTDVKTGERYSEQYNGYVDYTTMKNSKVKFYLLSPFEKELEQK